MYPCARSIPHLANFTAPTTGNCDLSAELLAAGFTLAPGQRVLAAGDSPLARGLEAWRYSIGSRGLSAVGEVIFGANQEAFEALRIVHDMGLAPQAGWQKIAHNWAQSLPLAATVADDATLDARLAWLCRAGFNLHAGLSSVLQQGRADLIPALLRGGANPAQSDLHGNTPARLWVQQTLDGPHTLETQCQTLLEIMRHDVEGTIEALRNLASGGETALPPRVPRILTTRIVACARQNEAWAQVALGLFLTHGLFGFDPDAQSGRQHFEHAARQGHAHALLILGQKAGQPNLSNRWLAAAAAKGDPRAQHLLAQALLSGSGIAKNPAAAMPLLEAAAGQWLADAQHDWGLQKIHGQTEKQDLDDAARWLHAAACQGHVASQRVMSLLFRQGWGVPQSAEMSAHWCRQAAMQNDAHAQFDLGLMLEQGQGVERNPAAAALCWGLSAKQGHLEAMNRLGEASLRGEGVPLNFERAYRWLEAAADRGSPAAQYNLAGMFATGRLGAIQKGPALQWLQQAARQGFASAQFDLAMAHATGWGVARNDKEAAAWLKHAADNGHARAQCTLSEFYANGRGVSADPAQADFWLKRAAQQGFDPAQKVLAMRPNHKAATHS